jgi:hypothetical protein
MYKKNFYMQTIEGRDNSFGFGETDQTYAERQKMPDYSKVKGYAFAIGEESWKDFGWWENRTVIDQKNKQDSVVHQYLDKIPGIWRRSKRDEVFRFDKKFGLTLEIIKNMIHQEFFSDRKEDRERVELILHPYQQEFVDKAHSDYDEFLLAAKCRAGKSVMVLSHICDKNHKVSLVVSRFNSPAQSWLSDPKTFDKFTNLVIVELKDKNWVDQLQFWLNTDKQIILWSTVQGVVRKLDRLIDTTNIDLLVFDEAHVGDKAKQFGNLRETLSDTPCLKVSGTAYDQLWDTTEENRFVYDYWQEQIDVQKGIIDRPSMSVVLAKYQSDRYSDVYDDAPDAMKNLFLVKDNQFVDEFLVKEFVAKYFDTNRDTKPKDRLLYSSNHIYMTLPSVPACHLLQVILDPIIPTKVVTGDTGTAASDIEKFVKEHNRSVCLTYSANVLGMTQSLWDTVINAREGKSVQFWTQFAFRAGSGDHNWRVIDFVPSRALESLRETFCLANDLDPILSEYEFTDFVPIYEWDNGFETLTTDQVNNILASDIGSTTSLMTGGTEFMDLNALSEFDFGEYRQFDKEITKRVVLNNEANNGLGAKQRINERNKAEKTDLQMKIQTVRAFLSYTPQVILEEHMLGHTINTISDLLQSKFYPHLTGDYNGMIGQMVDKGTLSSASLTRRVNLSRISIDSALSSSDFLSVHYDLQKSAGSHKGIPVELLDEMIV